MSPPQMSALIRCRDEVRGIGPLIDALRAQTGLRADTKSNSIEIVVVDSGSRDGTVEEVRRRGIEPIRIAPDEFTYGRALNLAAAAANAPLCVAISAHARPLDEGWADRMLSAFDDQRLACAFGERVGPDLQPLTAPLLQDLAHAQAHPFYGYSNSAGGFRRELWEQRPFDEELPASEDREWAWYWLQRGWLVLLDPGLAVHHSHADEGPLRTFARARGNRAATRRFRELEPLSLRAVIAEWWRGPHLHRSKLRARLDPRRAAQLAGKYVGLRWPGT
jgi:glycosyltransferase involved in cell wall biosynthesis